MEDSSNKVIHYNIPKEEITKLSKLVEGDDETFIKFFDGKDYGTIKLYEKMIDSMWKEARDAKDKLIEGYSKAKDKEKVKNLVHSIYTVLLDLEHKFYVLTNLERRYFDVSVTKKEP